MENMMQPSLLENGQKAFAAGDFLMARESFEKLVSTEPDHFEALNNLGVIAFTQNHYKEAESYFEKSLRFHKTYRTAVENLAKCLMLQGKYIQAVQLLQKYLALGLIGMELIQTLTQCYLLLNQPNAAQSVIASYRPPSAEQAGKRFLQDWISLHEQKKRGFYAKRSWCREQAALIHRLESFPGLNMIRGRFWEYPFVFQKIMEKPQSRVIDIGVGHGAFAMLLAENGHQVTGVEQDAPGWEISKQKLTRAGVQCLNADACNLAMIPDAQFDTALLISVIEHIPSNTIWCEKRQTMKTGPMLREEIPQKAKAVLEALRVVKPGGRVILTSDIYLDYPAEMNISWKELMGLQGIDRPDFTAWDDLYITDNPIHKGRGVAVGIEIQKK